MGEAQAEALRRTRRAGRLARSEAGGRGGRFCPFSRGAPGRGPFFWTTERPPPTAPPALSGSIRAAILKHARALHVHLLVRAQRTRTAREHRRTATVTAAAKKAKPSVFEIEMPIAAPAEVDARRVRLLTAKEVKAGNAQGPVVYWMNRDQRVEDNWALLHAAHHAKANKAPLCVVFSLAETYCGHNTARHRCFMLRGLKEVAASCHAHNVGFAFLNGDPAETIPEFIRAHGVRRVVCDMNPMREGRAWRDAVADAKLCPLEEVDAHNIVPVWLASPKVEVGARTLRAKIHRQLPEMLTEFPDVKDATAGLPPPTVGKETVDWDAAIERARANGAAVPELAWAVPGEAAAKSVLNHFLASRLRLYEKRNDPAAPQALSGLSPYLRYGQLSAQRAALAVTALKGKVPKEAADGFIEEMVVRRELADNFVFYTPDEYDKLSGQKYDWARETLQAHAGDRRPHVYTREQLDGAKTHDDLWNAAQKELVHGGKMHGFMRMYWAKKILEWTRSPEEALDIGIYLNDRYSLDGRDPNGYTGVMWSIAGVHDQGWKEREVFGKIRYMNYDGCKRKFNISAYVSRVNALTRAVSAKDAGAACNPGGWSATTVCGGSSSNAKAEAVDRAALVRLAKSASKAADGEAERCVDALGALGKLAVDKDALIATEVGKLVKPLTKSGNADIAKAAKDVTTAWKRVVLQG